jgi:protocatechuate 3,4-dioxygenase beta subunit
MTPPHTTQDAHDDDEPVGRVLTRREALAVLAAAGLSATALGAGKRVTAQEPGRKVFLSMLLGPPGQTQAPAPTPALQPTRTAVPTTAPTIPPTSLAPACVVRPEKTEGPYFVDEGLNRSDIRSDPDSGSISAGALFSLTFAVSKIDARGCSALAGAQVDIWHCDAAGAYSDVGAMRGQKYLRGHQLTDANGRATFTTIYPGWYPGRVTHIHFKIRLPAQDATYDFTSQLYFPDAMTDAVYANAPYNTRAARDRINANDGLYSSQLLLSPLQEGAAFNATFGIGLAL